MAFLVVLFATLNLLAKTVLFIGDSHSVGPFGQTFDQHLRDAGLNVATYASCGSIPAWWVSGKKTTCGFYSRDLSGKKTLLDQAPTPIINDLLDNVRPDVVVMEFGANYVTTTNDQFVKNDLKQFLSIIKESGAACFFITQPDSRKFRSENPRLVRLIKESVGDECPIFESYLVTKYPETGGDGVHYWNQQGTPIAREWAKKVFENFLTIFP